MPRLLIDTTPLQESPDFRRLWAGLGLSSLGTQLTLVAVGLEVYALTGSSFAVGGIGIAALVPLVITGLYGGAVLDVHDRRKVALSSAIVLWVVTALLALQAWLDVDQLWVLYALVAVQHGAYGINSPARTAIIPMLVPPRSLPAANALQTLVFNTTLMVGPVVGAMLVAHWDYEIAYTIDAVMFLAALWAMLRLPALPPGTVLYAHDGDAPVVSTAPTRRPGLGAVVEGLRYLSTQPNVRMTFLVDLAAMVLAMPRVLFPAIGVVVLGGGESTTGLLTAAIAVGGVVAGLLSGGLTGIRRQGAMIVWSITVWGLGVAAFGAVLIAAGRTTPSHVLVPALVVALVALAVCGAADNVSAIFRQSILQTAAPDDMRGRLQGVFIVVVAGGPRAGDMWLGTQAHWWGEGMAALVGGLSCIVVLWLLVRWQRGFLAYDADHPTP
ncbi:transmembrane secretion effector [Flavimobilis soli]|uniref:Transmembrane secretion effector n=1 Tax=Flavimobilis soli TaxID=442709 RepID=A0A2A9ED81_9MICO|nr:MFS transporter [Flavimobilis soli]PFG36763.1 transmembrane secretion effector [Flavimobilis soli]